MKLLVYAFGPFGQNKQNISEQVLLKLRKRKNITTVTLPVEFDKAAFINVVKKTKPGVIIGLGQYPRGKKIRLERRAINQSKTKAQPLIAITKGGQNSVNATLRLRANRDSWISYNAGKYVCNYSMYVLLTDVITKSIPLAFIHIPKNMGANIATKFVEDKIDEVLTR